MSFLSVKFAIFFIILFIILIRVTDIKKRNILLLTGNFVFYSLGDLRCLLLLAAETAACYFVALKLEREKKQGESGKAYVLVFAAVVVAVLILCKNFFQPLGISFFSLMIISYIVDVYRGKLSCEHDFTVVALYISFFPHIVSGPITKARDIMGQFKEINPINKKDVYYGIQIFVTGALKKVLIADRLAVCSNAIYSNPMEYSGFSLLLGTICYTVQLYCDFSGYTDMATGIATALGFKLARNFDLPYI
nr:hypothetical protein [Lachnospiraceae bacterium]